MNRNEEKIKAILYSIKSNQYDGGHEFESFIDFVKLIIDSKDTSVLKSKDNEVLTAIKASVFAIISENYGEITDSAINFYPETNGIQELSMYSTASMAILTKYALNDVSIGCWGSYLIKIISVDEYFKQIVNAAIRLSTEEIEPSDVFEQNLLGTENKIHNVIIKSLYCCLISQNNYKNAIYFAKMTKDKTIPIIVGILMSAKTSFKNTPEEYDEKIEDLAKRLSEKEFEKPEEGNSPYLFSSILPTITKALDLSSPLHS